MPAPTKTRMGSALAAALLLAAVGCQSPTASSGAAPRVVVHAGKVAQFQSQTDLAIVLDMAKLPEAARALLQATPDPMASYSTGPIAQFKVKVTGPNLAAPIEQSVDAVTCDANGGATFEVQGLPPGPVTVVVNALDAAGKIVSYAVQDAVVQPSVTTQVTMQCQKDLGGLRIRFLCDGLPCGAPSPSPSPTLPPVNVTGEMDIYYGIQSSSGGGLLVSGESFPQDKNGVGVKAILPNGIQVPGLVLERSPSEVFQEYARSSFAVSSNFSYFAKSPGGCCVLPGLRRWSLSDFSFSGESVDLSAACNPGVSPGHLLHFAPSRGLYSLSGSTAEIVVRKFDETEDGPGFVRPPFQPSCPNGSGIVARFSVNQTGVIHGYYVDKNNGNQYIFGINGIFVGTEDDGLFASGASSLVNVLPSGIDSAWVDGSINPKNQNKMYLTRANSSKLFSWDINGSSAPTPVADLGGQGMEVMFRNENQIYVSERVKPYTSYSQMFSGNNEVRTIFSLDGYRVREFTVNSDGSVDGGRLVLVSGE